ncbi:glycosyltransferase [uncultured Pelagimonas sp.]|uniref:glycosyltransferase n=1 Tax=uncultured Pelagimonas sp. TaxID=1618102 RepID=UPI0026281483|nr:glycosyltransferase [uncultured Pelagimonas sp.]
MAAKDMHIAVLCDRTPNEHPSLGRAKLQMVTALRDFAGQVTEFAPLPSRGRIPHATVDALSTQITNGGYDVVLSVFSMLPTHKLAIPQTIVQGAIPYAVRGVPARSTGRGKMEFDVFNRPMARWLAHRDATTLRQLDMVLWPTDVLQEGAVKQYQLNRASSHLVPLGGHCDCLGQGRARLISHVAPIHLLFVGEDWLSEGGAIAFETLQVLRRLGIDARLTVIGCLPPDKHVNDWVTVHPFLNLSVPDEQAAYCAALERAHFLIRPVSDSFGFSVCDASACGLPTLCCQAGQTPVQENINGHILPIRSGAEQYSNWVRSYLDSPGAYVALSRRCQDESKERLTWSSWGAKASQILGAGVGAKRNLVG